MSIIENALKKAGKLNELVKDDAEQLKYTDSSEVENNFVDLTCKINSEIQCDSEESAWESSLAFQTEDVEKRHDPFGEISNETSEIQFLEQLSHEDNKEANTVEIDWQKLSAQGYLNNNVNTSALFEEFRVIKRPIVNNINDSLLNGSKNRSNLILICSSLAGEGKTFISINLALSLANELDKNILLIDADVVKPEVSLRLGIKDSPGMIDYLENDGLSFADIVLKTDLPNFSVIPAGKRHKFSTELFSSQRMAFFADEISRRYADRIVIFDSSPLLMTTQAQVLAELVGQVVLVIAANSTPQKLVSESIAKLSKCQIVMSLLNKTIKDFDFQGLYGKYGNEYYR